MEQLESNVNILIDECARKMKNIPMQARRARFWTQGTKTPGEGACVSSLDNVSGHEYHHHSLGKVPASLNPLLCKNDFNSLNAN